MSQDLESQSSPPEPQPRITFSGLPTVSSDPATSHYNSPSADEKALDDDEKDRGTEIDDEKKPRERGPGVKREFTREFTREMTKEDKELAEAGYEHLKGKGKFWGKKGTNEKNTKEEKITKSDIVGFPSLTS
jgi:hypothetical protein